MNGMFRLAACLIVSGAALAGCQAETAQSNRYLPRCPVGNQKDLFAPSGRYCWLDAKGGVWQTVNVDTHYDVAVIEVEATDLADADEIAHRFVANKRGRYSEMLVYVRPRVKNAPPRVRRIQWTSAAGFSAIEFQN